MIFTARQLEDLHKNGGEIRLPVGARFTPLASDWLRKKGVTVSYDGQATASSSAAKSSGGSDRPAAMPAGTPAAAGTILWWCDGPCGQAKAAIAAQARETNLQPMSVPAEPKSLIAAIRHLAAEIKYDRAAGGILLVQTGAAAVVYANRCPSLRAILGTCRDAVQQGVDLVSANVLIVETPYQTVSQVRNLLTVFVRPRHGLNDDVKRQLKDLASCE